MHIETGASAMIHIDNTILNMQEQRELLEWFKLNRRELFDSVAGNTPYHYNERERTH